MIQDDNRAEVKAQMPEAKAREKSARTIEGAVLSVVGLGCIAVGFRLAVDLVAGGGDINAWAFALSAVPTCVGLFLFGMGAHRASGELTSAYFKDVRDTLAVWRRTGGGS
jgi:hypothetical protein